MSGDRLIPDLANDPPPEPEDDDRKERARPERPRSPWGPPPGGSQPPPPVPPNPELPLPQPPRPLQEQPTYPYVHEEETVEEDPEATPYTSRFQLILGALLGIAAVAIVAAILVGSGSENEGSKGWSSWAPKSNGDASREQEIANHVAPTYRLDDGAGQLVAVQGGKPELAGRQVNIAIVEPASGIIGMLGGKGAMYTMCGLGAKCAIDRGKPSIQRYLLLRREALELALYTFRYVKGTDYVVSLLPPTKPTKKGEKPASSAMIFFREDLEKELDQPLTRTLSSPPPTSSRLDAAELGTLVGLDNRAFQYSLQDGPDNSYFMLLEPFRAG